MGLGGAKNVWAFRDMFESGGVGDDADGDAMLASGESQVDLAAELETALGLSSQARLRP